MPAQEAQDLAACAREPIHVPGSIQPHGFLLVIDPATDRVMQAAGDVASLVGFKGRVVLSYTQATESPRPPTGDCPRK